MKYVKRTAFLGLMLAFSIVMTALEQMLPPLPFLPPNVKLGLSNIIIMYCIIFVGSSEAFTLGALKSFFVFLMRGPLACVLSFSGGMLSILVIIILTNIYKEKISNVSLSISGAIIHNITQIAVYSILLKTNLILYYIPFLIVSGIIIGVVTGTILNALLPIIGKTLK